MNPDLGALLARTDAVMRGRTNGLAPAAASRLYVGVDLGTAYTVIIVVDDKGQPVAGEYQFAQVVRDGLVVDFAGAVELLPARSACRSALRLQQRLRGIY